jgi:hypothetical protein
MSQLINKTTKVMQLGAIVFIIPWTALYMFRVLFTPIIRSVIKCVIMMARCDLDSYACHREHLQALVKKRSGSSKLQNY